MAEKHIAEILNAAGIDTAAFTALKDLPEDAADFKAVDYTNKIKSTFSNVLLNEPAFYESIKEENLSEGLKKKLESSQYGRAANVTRDAVLKGMGYTLEDFKELPEEERLKIEKFIPAVVKKFTETKAGDPATQQKLINLQKEFDDLTTSLPEKQKVFETTKTAELNKDKFQFIVMAQLAGMSPKVDASVLAPAVASHLENNYAWSLSGLDASPMQKEKPTLKALGTDNKELSLNQLIKDFATSKGWIEEEKNPKDKKQSGKVTTEVEPDKKGQLKPSSHIIKKMEEAKTA